MGFRFRKSVSLGDVVRINFSKSGIGYSVGGKGFRVTKKATGGTRTTASIPGAGISYVKDYSNKKSCKEKVNKNSSNNFNDDVQCKKNYGEDSVMSNGNIENMKPSGLEELLEGASKALKMKRLCNWGMVLSLILFGSIGWLFFIGFVVWKWYIKNKGIIELNYEIDEEGKKHLDNILKPLTYLVKSNRVWKVGADNGNALDRKVCLVKPSILFPFKTDTQVIGILTSTEKLYFLPDALFIVRGVKVGAIRYSDIRFETNIIRFTESENAIIPDDAKVVGHRWQHEKKDGGQDLRYKDNMERTICLYGELTIHSTEGFYRKMIFSNVSGLNNE